MGRPPDLLAILGDIKSKYAEEKNWDSIKKNQQANLPAGFEIDFIDLWVCLILIQLIQPLKLLF